MNMVIKCLLIVLGIFPHAVHAESPYYEHIVFSDEDAPKAVIELRDAKYITVNELIRYEESFTGITIPDGEVGGVDLSLLKTWAKPHSFEEMQSIHLGNKTRFGSSGDKYFESKQNHFLSLGEVRLISQCRFNYEGEEYAFVRYVLLKNGKVDGFKHYFPRNILMLKKVEGEWKIAQEDNTPYQLEVTFSHSNITALAYLLSADNTLLGSSYFSEPDREKLVAMRHSVISSKNELSLLPFNVYLSEMRDGYKNTDMKDILFAFPPVEMRKRDPWLFTLTVDEKKRLAEALKEHEPVITEMVTKHIEAEGLFWGGMMLKRYTSLESEEAKEIIETVLPDRVVK